MTQTYLTHRFDELRSLLDDSDMSRTTRRLLDFLADVDLPDELKRDTIAVRARYNSFAAQEASSQNPSHLEAMFTDVERIIDAIEKHLFPEDWESLGGNPPPNPDGQLQPPPFHEPVIFEGLQIAKRFVSSKYTFELPRLNLQLKLGEITGIVGENGNGKTTLLRIVAGDLRADGGNLLYPSLNVEPEDWYHIKQHIAFIPQHLTPWQGKLKENLHFAAAIHGIKGAENEARVDFVFHRLGLTQYEEAFWNEISSGFKLRFELARALVRKPSLLILDEPLANLDINTQQIFLQDLRYLADSVRYPMSILISSQHLHEMESIADNILFIKNGEALYNGKMDDFGKDRTENLFELSTSLSKAEVEERMGDILDGIRIEDNGSHLIFHTPLELDNNELLAKLVGSKIPIEYFRDISTSTLKLFREMPTS